MVKTDKKAGQPEFNQENKADGDAQTSSKMNYGKFVEEAAQVFLDKRTTVSVIDIRNLLGQSEEEVTDMFYMNDVSAENKNDELQRVGSNIATLIEDISGVIGKRSFLPLVRSTCASLKDASSGKKGSDITIEEYMKDFSKTVDNFCERSYNAMRAALIRKGYAEAAAEEKLFESEYVDELFKSTLDAVRKVNAKYF